MPKIIQITAQLHSFHMLDRSFSKSFKLAVNSTWTENFQMYKLDWEQAEEPDIKLPTFIEQNTREFQKNIYFCFIDYTKAFDSVNHNKLWEILKEMGIPDHLTCLLRNLYMQVKKQQLELDVEELTCSKLGKEYVKAVYCQPSYLTYMWSTSWEMPGWMKHS